MAKFIKLSVPYTCDGTITINVNYLAQYRDIFSGEVDRNENGSIKSFYWTMTDTHPNWCHNTAAEIEAKIREAQGD